MFGIKKKYKAAQDELMKLYAIGFITTSISKHAWAQSLQRMIDAGVLQAELKYTTQEEDESND